MDPFDGGYRDMYCKLGLHTLTPCTYCGYTTPTPPSTTPAVDTTSFMDGLSDRG
ncbi:hypothetical protein DFO66_103373 [Brevibacterium sanguinis]|uniref:Uncharacterized protein n=2 Tax=Brevibacterium TaxID=1696 RepID=A0A366INB5_9MICO|nr:hypothetical protein DFO66_103373 [Brevibacterium sanguinis]RBP73075.1 hypothetical protein DFO65_103373 [Brevibacterium celere]